MAVSLSDLAKALVAAGLAEESAGYGHATGEDIATWLHEHYIVDYRTTDNERYAARMKVLRLQCGRCNHTWQQHGGLAHRDLDPMQSTKDFWTTCSACECEDWVVPSD